MKRYKLAEMITRNDLLNDVTLLTSDIDLLPSYIRNTYKEYHTHIDNVILLKYGELQSAYTYDTPLSALTDFHNYALSFLFYSEYKYKTLLATTQLDYNPIWNVEGTETITKSGSDTYVINEKNNTTETFGEENITTNYGKEKSVNNIGEIDNTTTDFTTPYDSASDLLLRNKTDNNTTARTDTIEKDSKIDSTTVDERINTSENNKGGTNTTEYNTTITTERQGNIGVTSTQHLINEERQVALFNIYDEIFTDLFENFFLMIYE